jgi:hypothetical protein
MRNLLVKVFFVALVLGAGGAAIAGDQSVWYGQQTPTSTGLNQQNRWNRDALGTWPRDFQSPPRARGPASLGKIGRCIHLGKSRFDLGFRRSRRSR